MKKTKGSLLSTVAALPWKIMRATIRALAKLLSPKGKAGGLAAASTVDPSEAAFEAPSMGMLDGPDADNDPDTDMQLAYKRAGKEPEMIIRYPNADKAKHAEMRKLFTRKTRLWLKGLDEGQLAILGKSSEAEIAGHTLGLDPIKGVTRLPMFGKGPQKGKAIDPMKNPYAPDLASKVIDQVRSLDNSPKADSLAAKQADEVERRIAKTIPTAPASQSMGYGTPYVMSPPKYATR